jgi:hypothetical protein
MALAPARLKHLLLPSATIPALWGNLVSARLIANKSSRP